MNQANFIRWVRIAIYYASSALVTYGTIKAEWLPIILATATTVANVFWSRYGMTLTAKLDDLAKIAEDPTSPLLAVVTTPNTEGHKLAAQIPGPVVPAGSNQAQALMSGTSGGPGRRSYRFELPINVPWFYVRTLIDKIVAAGLWDPLPLSLTNRLVDANRNNSGLEITRVDLDSIDDATWERALKVIG